jgi:hypothetical protein
LIDVNCFLPPKELAVKLAPVWYRKTREPGVVEVDRMLTQVLHANTRKFDSNYLYTLNYRAGNSPTSVKPSFFLRGNERMGQRYPSGFPWNRLLRRSC